MNYDNLFSDNEVEDLIVEVHASISRDYDIVLPPREGPGIVIFRTSEYISPQDFPHPEDTDQSLNLLELIKIKIKNFSCSKEDERLFALQLHQRGHKAVMTSQEGVLGLVVYDDRDYQGSDAFSRSTTTFVPPHLECHGFHSARRSNFLLYYRLLMAYHNISEETADIRLTRAAAASYRYFRAVHENVFKPEGDARTGEILYNVDILKMFEYGPSSMPRLAGILSNELVEGMSAEFGLRLALCLEDIKIRNFTTLKRLKALYEVVGEKEEEGEFEDEDWKKIREILREPMRVFSRFYRKNIAFGDIPNTAAHLEQFIVMQKSLVEKNGTELDQALLEVMDDIMRLEPEKSDEEISRVLSRVSPEKSNLYPHVVLAAKYYGAVVGLFGSEGVKIFSPEAARLAKSIVPVRTLSSVPRAPKPKFDT